MRTLLLLLLFVGLTSNIKSQTSDCIKDFDYLVTKIHDDYPGYHDKITTKTLPALNDLEKNIRQKINQYPDSCAYYLDEYADFFKDHHLRVRQIYSGSNKEGKQPEKMQVSTFGKNVTVNPDSLQQVTANSGTIEGVWKGFREEFAIIKQADKKYIAVAIQCEGWQPGQVTSEYQALNDTVFEVSNFSLFRDRKPYHAKASLHVNGKVLELHGDTRFVRKSGSEIMDKATLYSYVPVYPNGRNTYPAAMSLNDRTYFLRIPGFTDNSSNEIVTKHRDEIMSRPNLIIDIRNNGGGLDFNYSELAKLIYTRPYETVGIEWYATAGNIKLFEDALKSGEITGGDEGMKWTTDLVEAMKKNVGGFVTHPHNVNESSISTEDTVYAMPRNVGIIINQGNASSAEQFLLAAKESDKVILFGNCNTAGVLDYSNITPRPFPSGNYQLWCPESRSKRLPENPFDNIGIAPDILIPFPAPYQLYDKLDSWVYFVKNYLEMLDEKNINEAVHATKKP